MSKPGLNNSTNTQNMKDIQGGEKKVMKKSLTVILSSAMALSMFSSVAFGKTSADFTDLKNLPADQKAIFDAMISAGIFDGVTDTNFGLNDDMNRAQFAKIAAKILGLDASGTVSSFTDVKASDPANGYAVGAIEALKAAKVTDGVTDTTFDPAGKVTKEQLAAFLIRALGKDAEAKLTPAVNDATVSTWAKSYVAFGLQAKLVTNGADGTFGGTTNAPRSMLVISSAAAKAAVDATKKASVTEAKATGVKTVTVTLNKAVDDTKAMIALTKGATAVATTTVWSADKKTATLTLTDVKVSEGKYTATLSGLDAAAIDKATAEFTAENEKVSKLSFVNASDKIAKSTAVTVKIKAENQYGENAALTAGNYTAYVAGTTKSLKRNDDTGLLELTLDTKIKTPASGSTPAVEYQSEIDVIPINIFLTNTSISVQKTFKIGTEPFVSKIELGAVKYPATKTALTAKDDNAELAITRYDQYGDVVAEGSVAADRTNYDAVITPFSFDALEIIKPAAGGAYDKVKVHLKDNVEKSGDYTVNVYVGAASATGTVKVQSTKVANKVEIGSFTGTFAEKDTKFQYIPIVAYDADGNKLSADDIATNATNKRFTVSISGAAYAAGNNGNDAIEKSGENKGKIKVGAVSGTARGVVYVNVGIYTANIQQNTQASYTIQDVRKPETLVMDGSKPAQKAIAGATTTIKWFVKDQYGDQLDAVTDATLNTKYGVKLTVTGATYATLSGITAHTTDAGATYNFDANDFAAINKVGLVFTPVTSGGTAKVVAELIDKSGSTPSTIKSVDNSMTVLATTEKLTYSVTALKDLYAALDSSLTPAADKILSVSDAVYGNWAFNSKLGRVIEVKAKDKVGDDVAIPGSRVVSSFSNNQTIAKTIQSGNDVQVIGNKAGTAQILVVYKLVDGTTADATLDVNVKADQVVANTVTVDATNKTLTIANGQNGYDLAKNIKIVDNYGVEYTGANTAKYASFLGLQYVVSGVNTGGSVTVNSNGTIDVASGTTEFTLKVIAGSKSASILVTTP
ncbi:S-layer homology domain-containing protein [Paenibacillus sp. GP183]|uniref:S-layer homology domain-containing protein n=1 Tax=Paenibacillus sp. GP183 TaxID=1882751 RepID=UPI00089D9FAD|nr:S-layer homology domain-containing protein [Paenibacillus sp. GP183]SEC33753.1 S-layer homology domain-containing protein [Paenibacillus sp. GP183]